MERVVEIKRSCRRDSILNGMNTFKHVYMTHKIKEIKSKKQNEKKSESALSWERENRE